MVTFLKHPALEGNAEVTPAQALQLSGAVLAEHTRCASALQASAHTADVSVLSWAQWGGQGYTRRGFQVLWKNTIYNPKFSNIAIAYYRLAPK